MKKRKNRPLLVAIVMLTFFCCSVEPEESLIEETAVGEDATSSPSPVVQPDTASYSPQTPDTDTLPTETSPDLEEGETPQAVDIGNPKDTGPSGSGKVKIYLADAPLDDLQSLVLSLQDILIQGEDGTITPSVPLEDSVDILEYTEGKLWLMQEVELPVGVYSGVGVTFDQAPVASYQGNLLDVVTQSLASFIPGENRHGLFGVQDFEVVEGVTTELVLHVDLHHGFVEQTVAGVQQLLLAAYHDLYERGTRGSLLATASPLIGVVCLKRNDTGSEWPLLFPHLDLADLALLPSDCYDSDARGSFTNNQALLAHLKPGTYNVLVYLQSLLLLPTPMTLEIYEDETSYLNLTGF